MQRYLTNFDTSETQNLSYDAVIVGTGLAGIFTALSLPRGLKTAVLCKGKLTDSDSYLAQGGIAASIGADDRSLHIRDTMAAGCEINNLNNVEVLINESENAIRRLEELGVTFDRDENGRLKRSLEGSHSVSRILHVNGDTTGKGIMDALLREAKKRENIILFENTVAVDLITDGELCLGLLAENGRERLYFTASDFVIATGGIGQLYPKTTNATALTSDGIAMADRAGLTLSDMEYIQFHPTALYLPGRQERCFLISETVRGEGAKLKNSKGEHFMSQYDERLELAPRDIVARAIYDQMSKTHSPCAYLDITDKSRDFLKGRFPTIFNECLSHGIDISKHAIPIAPVEHYFMGGIKTDGRGCTAIRNLYAVGECACSGVHGANRLASNSLLEAVVFGGRIAEAISGHQSRSAPARTYRNSVNTSRPMQDPECLRGELHYIMHDFVGIIRTKAKLRHAGTLLGEVLDRTDGADIKSPKEREVFNMYQTAQVIVDSALKNSQCIGSHYLAPD